MTGAFAAALLDPGRAVPAGLTDPAGRPAGRRFAVYRNNVVVGLTEALATAFPSVCRQLGADSFARLAGVFVRAHPPSSPLLMFYGDALPGFLAGFQPLADRPWAADLARLDLALRESYHAADAAALDAAAIAALPPDRLLAARVRLSPALRLVLSSFPLLDLWRAEGAPAEPPCGQDILVLRPGFDPQPHALPPGGAGFVAALLAGRSLGEAMDAAGSGHPLAETWTLLLTGGALTALEEATA